MELKVLSKAEKRGRRRKAIFLWEIAGDRRNKEYYNCVKYILFG